MPFSVVIMSEKKTQVQMFVAGLGLKNKKVFGSGVCYYDSLDGIAVFGQSGHLLELAPPEHYYPSIKSRWSLDVLPFDIKRFVVLPKPEKNRRDLIDAARWALVTNGIPNEIAIATDDDKEGDLLGYELLEYLRVHDKAVLTRLSYRQIDIGVQLKAYQDRVSFERYFNRMLSATTRRNYDWLIGMMFTMGLSVTNQHLIPPGQALHAGRVIFGMLYILVEHHRRIRNFVPTNYFHVSTKYSKEPIQAGQPPISLFKASLLKNELIYTGDYLSDPEKLNLVLSTIRNNPSPKISSVEKKLENKSPPTGLARTDADKLLCNRLSITLEQSKEILQKLYEIYGLTTYPRSDEQGLDADDYSKMPQVLSAIQTNILGSVKINPALKSYYQSRIFPLLDATKKPPIFKMKRDAEDDSKKKQKKVAEDVSSSHTAIRPTENVYPLDEIEDICRDAYLLIADRLLMQFLGDLVEAKVRATLNLSDAVSLRITGSAVRTPGWTLLRTKDEEAQGKAKDENDILPDFNEGDSVHLVDVGYEEKVTEPPKYFTPVEFTEVMSYPRDFVHDRSVKFARDELTLGTSATRESHVNSLLPKGFVTPIEEGTGRKKVVRWMPTNKAIALNQLAPEFLKYPEISSKWEMDFKAIDRGDMSVAEFEQKIKPLMLDYVQKCKTGGLKLSRSPFPSSPCGHVNQEGQVCNGIAFKLRSKEKNTIYWRCRTCGTPFSDEDGKKGKPFASSTPAVPVEGAPELDCPDCNHKLKKFERRKRDDQSKVYFVWSCSNCKSQYFDKNDTLGSKLMQKPNQTNSNAGTSAGASKKTPSKKSSSKKTTSIPQDPAKKTSRKKQQA